MSGAIAMSKRNAIGCLMRSFALTGPLFIEFGIFAVYFVVGGFELVLRFQQIDLRCFRARIVSDSDPLIKQLAMRFKGLGGPFLYRKVVDLPGVIAVEIEFFLVPGG